MIQETAQGVRIESDSMGQIAVPATTTGERRPSARCITSRLAKTACRRS